ncbi:hypothetical protein BKA56DRAFT_492617 [Ilyonectria sp. MPI-CAGE-AT-0026]|nr:hypothetical protein BKA56DRAFT_492617 [Ilyonectria sp. MPI-CAGE-AT-0026]
MGNQDLPGYLASDTFWALGIFIAANAVWINRQKKLLGKPKDEDIILEDQDSVTDNAPVDLHITSRPRQIMAIAFATLVLPLLLLESAWVIIPAFSLTVKMLKATYPSFKPRILGFVLYLPLTLIMLLVWYNLFNAGSYLVVAQWKYIRMLVHYRPSARDRSSPEEEGLMDSEGEWRSLRMGKGYRVEKGVRARRKLASSGQTMGDWRIGILPFSEMFHNMQTFMLC